MHIRRLCGRAALAAFFAMALSSLQQLDAQVLKAQVLGTVSDQSGAVVPGARVVLTETNTNLSRSRQSNESGLYVFPNLDPGTYRVSAPGTYYTSNSPYVREWFPESASALAPVRW